MELKPVTKEEWIAALRSGEFKQARNYLYDASREGYCCLGVLASLAGVPKAVLQFAATDYLSETKELYEALNLTEEIAGKVIYHIASEMNDEGETFDEIANWLEEVLP